MCADPVPGDINAPADPYTRVSEDVVEKALEAGNSAWPADEPGVQSDRQHLWRVEPRGVTLPIQRVERIAQIVEELCAGVEPLLRREAHVIAVERVRDHEVRYRAAVVAEAHLGPVG